MRLPEDHRKALCMQLCTYIATHPQRRETAQQILHFVLNTPDCFERSHAAGHITGSAWLLNPGGEKALLTLHRKLRLWVQPGGHADGDSDILRVALREAEEESGITGIQALSPEIYDVDIHTIPAHAPTNTPEHLHYDIRYLLQAPHENYAISDESDALAWVRPEELHRLTPAVDAAVLRLAALQQDAPNPEPSEL